MTKNPKLARKVGDRIRELRITGLRRDGHERLMTQVQLAESCGLNPLHLSCLERGAKLPGLVTYSNITLRWGITDDAELWEWRKSVANGNVESKNISIVLMDDTGSEKIRWNVLNCWPTAWTGPSLNAQTSDLAIEALELAHEGFEKA